MNQERTAKPENPFSNEELQDLHDSVRLRRKNLEELALQCYGTKAGKGAIRDGIACLSALETKIAAMTTCPTCQKHGIEQCREHSF